MKIRQAKKIRKGMFQNDKIKYSKHQIEMSSIRIGQYMRHSEQHLYGYFDNWDLI